MPSLTSHLINLDPSGLEQATTHPFLTAAATSSLPPEKLKHWLAQDRIYALSYISFIGTLLSRISIPTGSHRDFTIEWRAADALIDCLTNIRRELKLFEETAEREGWVQEICDCVCERVTRSYQDLFAGSVAMGRPVLVGLVILWATEECYLRAWKFARERSGGEVGGEGGDVMQRVFIPNWSGAEFEAFVGRLGDVVDQMCAEGGVEEGGWVWRECEAAWKQVVWVEREFWPSIEEGGGE